MCNFDVSNRILNTLKSQCSHIFNKIYPQILLKRPKEKTKITHINEGFDFLGFNIRKYREKLIIKPNKNSIKSFLSGMRETIKSNNTAKQENLILQLNPKIRGWTNYFRHVCAKKTFGYVSHCIFKTLWKWAKRRHPNKSTSWVKKRYFKSTNVRQWIFATSVKQTDGSMTILKLFDAGLVPIRRHIKIKADATPYDPAHFKHLLKRTGNKKWFATVA